MAWALEHSLLCRDEESSIPSGVMNFTLKVYLWVANTVLELLEIEYDNMIILYKLEYCRDECLP